MPTKTKSKPEPQFSGATPEPSDLDRFLTACKLAPGLRVLDIGTGRGAVAFLLSADRNLRLGSVVGVDVCPVLLEQAVRLAARDKGPRFVCANAEALPFEDASFDRIVTRRSPHHFGDIRGALAEFRRVLDTNGRLIVEDRSVPEHAEADELWNVIDKLHEPSHVRQYAPSAWREMLEEAGFDVEHIEPYSRDLPLELLLEGTSPAVSRAIEARLADMNDDLRDLMGLRKVDGEDMLRHNYVRLAARKRA